MNKRHFNLKKIPPGAWMFVLCCIRTVVRRTKKDYTVQKMDQRGRPQELIQKKIPPGAWMFVSCECCVLSGRGLCDELVPRPDESYRVWCVSNVCDHETSKDEAAYAPKALSSH
jgi:hypothetical protein